VSGLDLVVRNALILRAGEVVATDIGIAQGRIAALGPNLAADARAMDAEHCLVIPGFVDSHIHLDKTCILDRCEARDGSVLEAVRETAKAKAGFTAEDVYARGRRTLEKCLCHGTMRMRTHVEVDPGIGLRGFDGVKALKCDYADAIDIEICVFPQEGLLNNPGTEALLIAGLEQGATVLGAAPYCDSDPRGQIERIFAIATAFDVDIDMHLDMGDTPDGMQAEYVCELTERTGYGGRVTIGHVTQMSLLPPTAFATLATRLAGAGVAVTILPSTDLYLMGRPHTHAVPRGVVPAQRLHAHGVTCSIATNNVLNPFTPYGCGSLIRTANLFANIAQIGRPEDLARCLSMISDDAAALLRQSDYGIEIGHKADLVGIDATTPSGAVAELAQPLWGLKCGRLSFTRPRPMLHRSHSPSNDASGFYTMSR